MGILNTLTGWLQSPEPAVKNSQPRRAHQIQGNAAAQESVGIPHFYDALSTGGNRTPVPGIALSSVAKQFASLSRVQLANISDWLYENHPIVGYGVDTLTTYGAPILWQPASPNPEWNKMCIDWLDDWCKRADYTGRFTFSGIQGIASTMMSRHGGVGVSVTDEAGFPQVQLVSSLRIRSPLTQSPNNMDGVLITAAGRQLGFTVAQGADNYGNTNFATVPASEMMLLYEPESYEDYQGKPQSRRGSNDVRDQRDIQGFEKKATKINSALAAVLEGAETIPDDWDGGGATATSGTGISGSEKITVAALLGGDILALPEGKTLKMLDNKRPGDRIMEMLDYLGGCFVMGLGIPPAFLLDAKLTGPNQRSVNGKAQRRFDKRQERMADMVEWIYSRVVGWAIANGQLPSQDQWWKMEWSGPAKISIDDGRDAAQWRQDLQAGLLTRQGHFANRQLDWKRETEQGFTEDDYIIAKAADVAKKHGIPIDWILVRWGYVAAKPAPAQPNDKPGDKPDPDEEDATTTTKP